MRTPIITLLLILFTRIGFSQATTEITGRITDAKNAPVESANIVLFKTPDSPRFNLGAILWEIRNFQDIQSTLSFQRDTRVFNIAFVYRFGISARPKPATAKPTDEQERVKLN